MVEKNLSYAKFKPEWVETPFLPLPEKTAIAIFQEAVEKQPDKTAFIYFDEEFSYNRLGELVDGFASGLKQLGVKKGDAIMTFMPNCIQHVIAYYGILKTGAIVVPCNVMMTAGEVEYQIRDSGAIIAISVLLMYPVIKQAGNASGIIKSHIVTNMLDYGLPDANIPDMFKDEPTDIPQDAISFKEFVKTASSCFETPEMDFKNDLAMILYTSGTTGPAKGVMHANYQLAAASIGLPNFTEQQSSNIVILTNYPMFQVGGWCVLTLPTVFLKGTGIIMPIFDTEEAVRQIVKNKVNSLFLAPTAFIGILNSAAFKENQDEIRKLLKTVYCSGAPIPGALKKEWEEKTGDFMYVGWGATEGMGYAGGIGETINHRSYIEGANGGPSHEVKYVDEKGEILHRGEVGEMCFKAPGVALGYWNKPQETSESFRDGWWHSGDAGFLDENDVCHFVERIKDLIVTSAWKVAPAEVEASLFKHPAVQEAAVYGVPDDYRGQIVKAAVILKKDFKGKVDSEEIIAFCRENLAKYKAPRAIVFVDELPMTISGKVMRRKLRENDATTGT